MSEVTYDPSVTYSVHELAEHWRVNDSTIYRMVKSGKLTGFKVGVGYRFTDKTVREYEAGIRS